MKRVPSGYIGRDPRFSLDDNWKIVEAAVEEARNRGVECTPVVVMHCSAIEGWKLIGWTPPPSIVLYRIKDMKRVIGNLFPQLVEAKWCEVNINDIAIEVMPLLAPLMPEPNNPFLNADYCDKWSRFLHKLMGIDYSWGGYLEDRSVIWAGHYHEKGCTLHVGVDYYVPTNTVVHCPVKAKLLHVFTDPDQNGGWGGKMIFEWEGEHFILAHLKNMSQDIGRIFNPKEQVALIAEAECNGGWSPHLHVQRTKKGLTLDEVIKLDGYVLNYEGIGKDFPDPAQLWD